MTDAITAYLERLAADDARQIEIRLRIVKDKRRSFLTEEVSVLEPKLYDGMAGCRAVFADLFSAKHSRQLRAKYLVVAREHQIRGHHQAASSFIAKAMMARRDEKQRID